MDAEMLTGVFPIIVKQLVDLAANITFWNLDIIFGGAIIGHEGEEAVVGDIELEQSYYHTAPPIQLSYS